MMSAWNRGLTYSICLALGVALGIGFSLARPGALRGLAKKFGRPDADQEWFYRQTLAFHRRVDACVPDGAVLFIGDSAIQGMCVTEVTKDGINYGIGGDTTEGVLARLPVYTSLQRARAVVFSVGDNDLRQGRSPAEVAANYQKIIAQVPKTVPVFFCSSTPCVGIPEHAEINRGIDSLNHALKDLCAAEPRCRLVALNLILNDERGCLRPEFADADGMHLNGPGCRLCIAQLREALAGV